MNTYRIGALARQTGCKVETIRFYESVGLMPVPGRTSSGHRRYTDADRRRLTFIRRARDLGFSMDDVRAFLDVSDNGERSAVDGCGLARAHLDSVRATITALRAMEQMLQRLSDDCTDTTRCRLLELFAHSERPEPFRPSGGQTRGAVAHEALQACSQPWW